MKQWVLFWRRWLKRYIPRWCCDEFRATSVTLLGHPLGLLLVGVCQGYNIVSIYAMAKSFQKNIFGLADVIRFDYPSLRILQVMNSTVVYGRFWLLKLRDFGSSIFVTRQTSQTPRWISTKKDMRGGFIRASMSLAGLYPYRI